MRCPCTHQFSLTCAKHSNKSGAAPLATRSVQSWHASQSAMLSSNGSPSRMHNHYPNDTPTVSTSPDTLTTDWSFSNTSSNITQQCNSFLQTRFTNHQYFLSLNLTLHSWVAPSILTTRHFPTFNRPIPGNSSLNPQHQHSTNHQQRSAAFAWQRDTATHTNKQNMTWSP